MRSTHQWSAYRTWIAPNPLSKHGGPRAERVLELPVRHLRRETEAWAVPEDVVESHAGELKGQRAEVKEAAMV